ncbi:early protein E2 [Alouatta guariba papillomavirus 1]|uniref:Regulatory protein E2 n=1 Tax=Alouatta guariba papillomavirus 1 TaxID=1784959 RepID=A0A140CBZ9_9PAPI|nr:early protein E2 [Alouatta guariba papillomavirus 1]
MDGLTSRLDALQERLIDCYEADSKDLKDHIEHWGLQRRECALLYRARQMGLHRVGLQVVPTLAVSQQKAHAAIELHLSLQGLQASDYGTEDWTLADTSMELWTAPPAKCFKKGGQQVEVWYDGTPDNMMLYTLWAWIYAQDDGGTWVKVPGKCDYAGLYYSCGGVREYYVNFQEDSARYGHTGTWEVHVGREVIYAPCDSVSSTSGTHTVSTSGLADFSPGPPCTAPDAYPRTSTPLQRPAAASAPPAAKRPRWTGPARAQRPSALPGAAAHAPAVPLDCVDASDTVVAGPVPQPALGGQRRGVHRGGRGHGPRHPRDHHGTDCDHQTAPVILLKGDANCLKCHRYRLRKYAQLYLNASTTWYWAGKEGSSRAGPATVCVSFESEAQRTRFLDTVPIPPGIRTVLGTMPV